MHNQSEEIEELYSIEDYLPKPIRIRDMLFINMIERRLGRALTIQEVEIEEYDGELELYFPDGHREFIRFPRLDFPIDIMTKPGL